MNRTNEHGQPIGEPVAHGYLAEQAKAPAPEPPEPQGYREKSPPMLVAPMPVVFTALAAA